MPRRYSHFHARSRSSAFAFADDFLTAALRRPKAAVPYDRRRYRPAAVTVIDPHVSTRGETGHVVLTVLGMVARMERRFIRQRQRGGIERAKANGIYKGGSRRIDRAKIEALMAQESGPTRIAQKMGWSRMQVYRIRPCGISIGRRRNRGCAKPHP